LNYFYLKDINNNQVILTDDEFHHCVHVFRHQVNDKIYLINGSGDKWLGSIIEINKKQVIIKLLEKIISNQVVPNLAIAISVLKTTQRMEWMVEKLTEIGVSDIYFFISNNTERHKVNIEKLQRCAIESCKQSGNLYTPSIHHPRYLKTLLEDSTWLEKGIAAIDVFPYNEIDTHKRRIIFIGPEGDFTKEELQLAWANGCKTVNLGTTILRSETAAIVASIQYR